MCFKSRKPRCGLILPRSLQKKLLNLVDIAPKKLRRGVVVESPSYVFADDSFGSEQLCAELRRGSCDSATTLENAPKFLDELLGYMMVITPSRLTSFLVQ